MGNLHSPDFYLPHMSGDKLFCISIPPTSLDVASTWEKNVFIKFREMETLMREKHQFTTSCMSLLGIEPKLRHVP